MGFKKQTLAAKIAAVAHDKPAARAAAGAQSFGAEDALQLQTPKRMSPFRFV